MIVWKIAARPDGNSGIAQCNFRVIMSVSHSNDPIPVLFDHKVRWKKLKTSQKIYLNAYSCGPLVRLSSDTFAYRYRTHTTLMYLLAYTRFERVSLSCRYSENSYYIFHTWALEQWISTVAHALLGDTSVGLGPKNTLNKMYSWKW